MATKQDHNKSWIFAVIAVLIVITFMSLYFGRGPQVGKAVSIGGESWTGAPIDLELEEKFNFTVLPNEGQPLTVPFRVGASGYPTPLIAEYSFMLERIDAMLYKYTILRPLPSPATLIASDLIYTGGTRDISPVYLNTLDSNPDLEVAYRGSQIEVKNVHYLSPDSAKIVLRNVSVTNERDAERVFFPSIIRMSASTAALLQKVTIQVNASSSATAPEAIGVAFTESIAANPLSRLSDLNPSTGLTIIIRNLLLNYSLGQFTYIAPTVDGAEILAVNTSVRGQISKAFYVFAIGDVIYALRDSGFPRQTLLLNPLLANNEADLAIDFLPTTNLQPLALPCSNESSFNIIFANKAVKRVYSYKNGAAQIWTNQSLANDFTNFSSFQGYFVELSEAAITEVTLKKCKFQLLEPFSALPPDLGGTIPPPVNLPSGWNLFSLPGILPHPLSDFISETEFRVFECSQGYTCREIPSLTVLKPGKPYWIYSTTPLVFRYLSREAR